MALPRPLNHAEAYKETKNVSDACCTFLGELFPCLAPFAPPVLPRRPRGPRILDPSLILNPSFNRSPTPFRFVTLVARLLAAQPATKRKFLVFQTERSKAPHFPFEEHRVTAHAPLFFFATPAAVLEIPFRVRNQPALVIDSANGLEMLAGERITARGRVKRPLHAVFRLSAAIYLPRRRQNFIFALASTVNPFVYRINLNPL